MRTGVLLLKMVLPVLVITLVKILEDLFYNPIRKRKVNQSIKEATNKLNDLEGKILTLPTAKAGGFLVRRSRPASRTYTVSPSV